MKPILFNTEMVKAILEGRKTVTRRVLKIQPYGKCDTGSSHIIKNIFKDDPKYFCCSICGNGVGPDGDTLYKAPYQVNDILYVRETWKPAGKGKKYFYKADWEMDGIAGITKWKPSIHMPKEAARIFLRVTDVRVERLQDMTREDMLKEGIVDYCKNCKATFGCDLCMAESAVEDEFFHLWNDTIKKDQLNTYGWYANPYVWVIEFEDISNQKDQLI